MPQLTGEERRRIINDSLRVSISELLRNPERLARVGNDNEVIVSVDNEGMVLSNTSVAADPNRIKKSYKIKRVVGARNGYFYIQYRRDVRGMALILNCCIDNISIATSSGDYESQMTGQWAFFDAEAQRRILTMCQEVERRSNFTFGEFAIRLVRDVMSVEIPTKFIQLRRPPRQPQMTMSQFISNRTITSEGLWHIQDSAAFKLYSQRQQLNTCIGYHEHHDPFCDWFTEPNKMSFGIELETQSKTLTESEMIQIFNEDLKGIARPERDGSLYRGDYVGVEFIFQPHSYNKLKELMPTLKNSFIKMRDNGIVSYDTGDCGCHIHTSTSGWGDTAETQKDNVAKATGFITYHKDFMRKVFERGQCDYCQWCPTTDFERVRHWVCDTTHCHGTSVECSKTFEFRYPRGCLSAERLWATIDLLNAFAKNSQVIEINDYDPVKWLKGITAETKDFLRRKGCFLAALD